MSEAIDIADVIREFELGNFVHVNDRSDTKNLSWEYSTEVVKICYNYKKMLEAIERYAAYTSWCSSYDHQDYYANRPQYQDLWNDPEDGCTLARRTLNELE
jgi:hypothetical protein